MSTHAQQLLKDMRNIQPNKTRRFKLLSEDSLVDSNNIPHPPLVPCENSSPVKSSHSISHGGSNLATDDCGKNVTSLVPNSLLDGCYDETANADSFKTALNEWRNAGTGTKSGTMNTSTDEPVDRKILELPPFRTNSALTYFDRLMLNSYRTGTNTLPEEKPAKNADSLQPSISEYNIFYVSENLKVEPNYEPEPRGDKDMNLKITTQTDLSSFFLLGTEQTNEIPPESTNQKSDNHAGRLVSGGRMSWRQDDAINSTDSSDSDSECSLVEFEDNNFSEDEEILTLERLSNELKSGSKSGMDSGLWAELMCHRPTSTSDFN